MASSFAGLVLFESGPHRFAMGRFGRHFLEPDRGINSSPTTWDRGQGEVAVFQRGRLVASDEASLMVLVDAIRAQAELPRTGTLVDHHGRAWVSMTMLRFEPEDRVDRGRVFSLGYTVAYRHIL